MIAREMTFQCPECGWRKCVQVGDASPEVKMIKYLKCPKCGTQNELKHGCESFLDGLAEDIKNIFK